MNATEQHVGIAAQMYECRATARRLLGERFKPKMREFGKIVQAVAKRDNCNEIVAGATVIKEAKLFGMDSLMLMAAVVEMVEPSNDLGNRRAAFGASVLTDGLAGKRTE